MTTHNVAWLIFACGEVLDYAEPSHVPGNYRRLRHRYAAVRGRFDRASLDDVLLLRRLLHLEVSAWADVLGELQDDVVEYLVYRLAPGRSGVWADLSVRNAFRAPPDARLEAASDACERALWRYADTPSSRWIQDALTALDEVVTAAAAPTAFTAAELRAGLDDLAGTLERLPPALHAFLALRAGQRFNVFVSDTSITSSLLGRRSGAWQPSWSQVGHAEEPAEPEERWFIADDVQHAYEQYLRRWEINWAHGEAIVADDERMQAARREEERVREERRLLDEQRGREMDKLHRDALAEDERRTSKAQKEQDRLERKRRAEEDEELQAAHLQRLRTDEAYRLEYAMMKAPLLAKFRLAERGLTLKEVIPSDRSRLIHEAACDLVSALERRFRDDGQ